MSTTFTIPLKAWTDGDLRRSVQFFENEGCRVPESLLREARRRGLVKSTTDVEGPR